MSLLPAGFAGGRCLRALTDGIKKGSGQDGIEHIVVILLSFFDIAITEIQHLYLNGLKKGVPSVAFASHFLSRHFLTSINKIYILQIIIYIKINKCQIKIKKIYKNNKKIK